ncbi:hypothetical protein ACLB2K_039379 [Fragaria x ananassa]
MNTSGLWRNNSSGVHGQILMNWNEISFWVLPSRPDSSKVSCFFYLSVLACFDFSVIFGADVARRLAGSGVHLFIRNKNKTGTGVAQNPTFLFFSELVCSFHSNIISWSCKSFPPLIEFLELNRQIWLLNSCKSCMKDVKQLRAETYGIDLAVAESVIPGTESEFFNLRQGDMTVLEYGRLFNRSYASPVVANERDKILKFLQGLRNELRDMLVGTLFTDFSQVFLSAMKYEDMLLERVQPLEVGFPSQSPSERASTSLRSGALTGIRPKNSGPKRERRWGRRSKKQAEQSGGGVGRPKRERRRGKRFKKQAEQSGGGVGSNSRASTAHPIQIGHQQCQRCGIYHDGQCQVGLQLIGSSSSKGPWTGQMENGRNGTMDMLNMYPYIDVGRGCDPQSWADSANKEKTCGMIQENSTPWSSPSGEFAFGFQKLGTGFILAIWFDKIPEKTIVWSANGNNLAQEGSTVELTTEGQLVLNDPPGEQRLLSDLQPQGTAAAYAAMLDTGNFVLVDQESNILWESFDQPTHTFLPTQILSEGSVLFSPYTATNYSRGRFQLKLESNGDVMFNQSGLIYVTDRNGTLRGIVSNKTVPMEDFYQRATLDYDGVFRHYIYQKNNGSSVWSTFFFMPEDICSELTEETGGGACGFNSICKQDKKGPTTCECPKSYTFIDPNDERKGCKQDFLPQSCDEASPETDMFGFQEMLNTDWPYNDYEHFQPVTEEWCKQICLSDCFCAIAIYDEMNCWKKGIPLSNGRVHLGVGWTSLVKIRLHNSTWRSPAIPDAKMKRASNLTAHIVAVLLLIITYLVVAMITYLVVSRIYFRKAQVSDLYPVNNLKCFTYVELKQATNGFKEELGRGAFATVFKGVLTSDKGKVVAVKRLDTVVRENDWEFKAEVSAIGGTNHRNLVKLQGFCNEGQHRILVYEFMSNGSLASILFGETRPNWDQRRSMALGTARGLLYLHEECSSQIIHCDIKPQNILLDDSYTARIADFGVAKLLKIDQTRTTTRIRGTKGYVAPEWYKSLPVTGKADVYSYGVLLLEIIFCRKNFEAEAEDDDQMILADWAYNCYKQQKLHLLLQNDDDEAKEDIRAVEKYVMIAFWCIQEDPSMRPTMRTVTHMLEGIVEVSDPPNPSSFSLCFLFLLQLLSIFTIANTYQNISLTSSLTAMNDNSSWPSPSGEFAFGFRKLMDGFMLAIWFDKIPEKTIFWSVRDYLVQQGSKVQITQDGRFLLYDITTGEQYLLANVSSATGVAYAAMLDTGNFVLADQNYKILWESFQQPTDTILPTQTLNAGGMLHAQLTPKNYSRGRFQLILQSEGKLVFYTTHFPLDYPNFPYRVIKTRGSAGLQVIFNQSGAVYLTDKDGSILHMISNNTVSMEDFYQRAILEFDGVFKHYVYPKSTNSSVDRVWSLLAYEPPNICTAISESAGGGVCGFNSLCEHDEKGLNTCNCPSSYTYIDPNDERKGCRPAFVPQSCDQASQEADLFEFEVMENTDWPLGDYDQIRPVEDEQWCKQNCLEDCFCAVALYYVKNKTCWKKGLPLMNGKFDKSAGWKMHVKKRKDSSNATFPGVLSVPKKKDKSALILVGSVLIITLTYLGVFIVTFLVISRIYYRKALVSKLGPVLQGINLKCFTYMELKEATNGFMEEIGSGAFSTVFKGVLASDDGRCIAVKRLNTIAREDDLEFKGEVSSIGRTNHRNLVQLLGFCDEGQHRLLVYEYMSNGSLASFLFGESRPNWYLRRHIALGTARGLFYLHEECSSQIIHCDIKPQNILIDDSFTARIADFGVAKLLRTDQTRTITRIRGTKGYVAPEWFKNLPITAKVDVYSYGILLLELICCRKKFDEEAEEEDQMILAEWAYACYKEKKLHLLLEIDDEKATDEIKTMEKYVMIAFLCIQDDPSLRPTMKNVIHMLEGTVEVSLPPDPSSGYMQFK